MMIGLTLKDRLLDPSSQCWENRENPKVSSHSLVIRRISSSRSKDEEEKEKQGDQEDKPNGRVSSTTHVLSMLKDCAKEKDLHKANIIHKDIIKMGLNKDNVYVNTAIVNMYAKCGALTEAQQVFDKLSFRNTAAWTALISGYVQHGHGVKALYCFHCMQKEGMSPNEVTFVCMLKACGSIGAVREGEDIYAEIVKKGFLENNIFVGNSVVDMYVKFGKVWKAREVFDGLPFRDVISWTTLISGYAEHGQCEEALKCFGAMQGEGIYANAATFVCILKACSSLRDLHKGREIHYKVVKERLLHTDVVIGNALVDMYAKCGALMKAREVFDELRVKNVVTWTALIMGYVQYGHSKEALSLFSQMRSEGVTPNAITFVCILKACGNIYDIEKGEEIHAEISRKRLLENNIFLATSLVDMYAKCGAIMKAKEVFDEIRAPDIVSWNALIGGYAQHGYGEEALDCFELMKNRCRIIPDACTFICVLKACGTIGASTKGRDVFTEIARNELQKKDIMVATALIDMYAKCGALVEAQIAFDQLLTRDLISWNALITGYSQLGRDDLVLKSLDKMVEEGIKPNSTSFLILLKTCCYLGLVDKGKLFFKVMSICYDVMPNLQHHTSMTDLFSHAGLFNEATEVIKKLPFSDDLTVWHTLLDICQNSGNVALGKLAFENALQLDVKDPLAYIFMSNIYAAAMRTRST